MVKIKQLNLGSLKSNGCNFRGQNETNVKLEGSKLHLSLIIVIIIIIIIVIIIIIIIIIIIMSKGYIKSFHS